MCCCGFGIQAQKTSFPVLRVDSSDIALKLQTLHYDDVETLVKKELAAAKRKKQSTETLEEYQRQAAAGVRYLQGTAQVMVIDSVVVDKANFLSAYGFTDEVGKVWTDDEAATVTFETERGNRRFKSLSVKADDPSEETFRIVYQDRDGADFAPPAVIEGTGVEGDMNYPFMMPDGTTFYFAARTEDGLGNYDLYVTRYDTEENRFLRAENMGFPFNSYANDYMLVVDEVNGVGWFASDRYQAPDSVCVYTFVPTASRQVVDYETTDRHTLRQQASLRPIRATWGEEGTQARALLMTKSMPRTDAFQSDAASQEFCLVVNDNTTYTHYDQFRMPRAAQLCREWVEKQQTLKRLTAQLDALRLEYASATRTHQRELTQQILDLERRTEQLQMEVHEAEKAARNAELKN